MAFCALQALPHTTIIANENLFSHANLVLPLGLCFAKRCFVSSPKAAVGKLHNLSRSKLHNLSPSKRGGAAVSAGGYRVQAVESQEISLCVTGAASPRLPWFVFRLVATTHLGGPFWHECSRPVGKTFSLRLRSRSEIRRRFAWTR